MRRETRPFVVEVRRGQQKKAPQPAPLPNPFAEQPSDDDIMRRAEEALFGRPAGVPGAGSSEPPSPARRILEALAPEPVEVVPEPSFEAPRRGRKPGSKNRPKEQVAQPQEAKRRRGRPPKNPESQVRSVPVTPELASKALEVIAKATVLPVAPVPVAAAASPLVAPAKRPRGRPRKVPLPEGARPVAAPVTYAEPVPAASASNLPAARIVARYRDGNGRPAGQIWTRRLRGYANPGHRSWGRPPG